ncbi:MAG: DUF805 domain-containing protein [Muribaculaceae bacterium]|nr:DUF805 domain-containing protein [Muribaculaceae bacterium]
MNVDFITAIKMYFANYANFNGRSTRAEYWWAMLFTFLVGAILGYIGSKWLESLVSLLLIVPTYAVMTRRFHDIGKSGWWVLKLAVIGAIAGLLIGLSIVLMIKSAVLGIIFLVFGIAICIAVAAVQIIWLCKPSVPDNEYGPCPYPDEL